MTTQRHCGKVSGMGALVVVPVPSAYETAWTGASWRDIPAPVIDHALPDYSSLTEGPPRARRGNTSERVYAALRRPASVATLVALTGLTVPQVGGAVWTLVKHHRIRARTLRVDRKAVYERIA